MIDVTFDRDAVSERLAEELHKLGMSQRKLGELFGCCQHLIYAYYKGRSIPGAYYLTLMHYAGCDIIYILTGERRA